MNDRTLAIRGRSGLEVVGILLRRRWPGVMFATALIASGIWVHLEHGLHWLEACYQTLALFTLASDTTIGDLAAGRPTRCGRCGSSHPSAWPGVRSASHGVSCA